MIRNFGLFSFAVLLLSWPLVQIFWECVQVQGGSFLPLVGRFLSGLDVGGQNQLSRSMLRVILSAGCVAGLLLPLPRPEPSSSRFQSVPWGPLFLLCGLVSVVFSAQLFEAEAEWETLALILLFASLLRRANLAHLPRYLLASFYLVTSGVILHALFLTAPGASGRLGGVFFHSNALSTFCLVSLPYLLWRALEDNWEGRLAGALSAGMLALLIGTGSMTGACLLFGGLVYSVLRGRWIRVIVALFVGFLPLLFNILEWSAVLYPVLLLGLLTWFYFTHRELATKSSRLIFGLSLVLVMGGLHSVPHHNANQGVVPSRGNSGAARLEFYRAGLTMAWERPILGYGPRAFSRQFPARQTSIRYYSKFVHCVPLEILLEWGSLALLLGLSCLVVLWKQSYESRRSNAATAFRWSLSFLLLHSLTGVQTQFPYLLLVVALAWVVSVQPKTLEKPIQSLGVAAVRAALALCLLGFFLLNSWRVSALFSRLLALDLHQRAGVRAQPSVRQLFLSSTELLPTCGRTWLLWSQVEKQLGDPEQGSILAQMTREWDQNWAIPLPYVVHTGQARRDPKTSSLALGLDPVNYPLFYVWRAESITAQSEANALVLLRRKSRDYSPQLLATLPGFRADDLKDQLGEFFLLMAILEERQGQVSDAERAFRMALYHCERRLSRLRRLLDYPTLSGLEPGPLVTELLAQLLDQVPAENAPRTIQVTTD